MEAEIQIDGKTVKFRATAAVPRLYRIKFRRDILQDMQAVRKAVEAKKQSEENIPPAMLELFEGDLPGHPGPLGGKHGEPGER